MFGLITGSLLFAGGVVFGGVVASRTKTNQQHFCDEGKYCCDICGHYVNESDIKWLTSDFGVCTECRVNMTDREIHDFLYVEGSDQYEKLRATLKKRVRARRELDIEERSCRIATEGIVFETRASAQLILDQMNQLIETYGFASIEDLYELTGVTGSYFYITNYGWIKKLDDARIIRTREGYEIKFPKAVQIK